LDAISSPRLAPCDAHLSADRARLDEVRRGRRAQAARYFRRKPANWDKCVPAYPEERVEARREAIGTDPIQRARSCTGTGRCSNSWGRSQRGGRIDQSPQMLSVARDRIERAGLRNVIAPGRLYTRRRSTGWL